MNRVSGELRVKRGNQGSQVWTGWMPHASWYSISFLPSLVHVSFSHDPTTHERMTTIFTAGQLTSHSKQPLTGPPPDPPLAPPPTLLLTRPLAPPPDSPPDPPPGHAP